MLPTLSVEPDEIVPDPPLARLLFADRRVAPLWLVVRVLVGSWWIVAAFDRLGDAAPAVPEAALLGSVAIAFGIALALGAFVGIVAFLGGAVQTTLLLTIGTNPIVFVLTVLLVLAWKNAGQLGLDRWLLPGLDAALSRTLAGE